MKKKTKIVLFDFDGVIADSFGAAFGVYRKIIKSIRKDEYRNLFDGNINEWKERSNFSKNEMDRIDADFNRFYLPLIDKVDIISGVRGVIEKLAEKYLLVIVSSTVSSPIRKFMHKHKLSSYFDMIMGNDVHKSKIEKIKMVFSRYGVLPNDCIFITDTLGDMREAAIVNVRSIGVAWGFQKKKNLLKGNPFRVVDSSEEIAVAVSEYFDSIG